MNKKSHLIIYTRGGHEFHVVGEGTEDVSSNVINRNGWASMELINGKAAQIYGGEIVAVVEVDDE